MNTQITISNIDDTVIKRLQAEAKKHGSDFNTYIIQLLKNSIGLKDQKIKNKNQNTIEFLAGTWSNEDYENFISNTSDFGKIDDSLWQ